jgi:hypothetical protein
MFNSIYNSNSFRLSIIALLSSMFLFVSFNIANASQSTTKPSPSMEEIMQQISALEAEIEKRSSSQRVQGVAPEHTYTTTDDGKAGRPKITINKPDQKAIFNKQDPNDPIVVTWDAKNIPSNSVIEVELEQIELKDAGVGGGIWQGEVPKGDSTGEYKWDIQGIGRAEAGTYHVRTSVRACHSEGCNMNPRFPGQKEKIKTYAKSSWRNITIVDRNVSNTTNTFKALLNGRKIELESDVTKSEAESLCKDVYNDYDQYEFTGGDVLKCYWGKKKIMTVDTWKG